MTDAELLAKFVNQRDQDALTQLVERYERLVWSVCSRSLANRVDREDAFQTTFLILVKNAHRIRKPGSLSNWLYGTARRVASRIRKRRASSSLDTLHYEGTEFADPQQPLPLDAIARQHEIDLVDHHLHAMPERDRTPLIMHYFAGLSAKEIAHQLHLTPAATEGRIRRARARLRAGLQREGIRYGSIAMLGSLRLGTSRPELAGITVEQCVATCAGATVGVSIGTLSLGTKMMICKGVCAFGISALLAVGSYFGMDSPPQATTFQVADVSAESGNAEIVDTVAISAIDNVCCPLMNGIACCGEVCHSLHDHMGLAHDSFAEKASELHGFVASLILKD